MATEAPAAKPAAASKTKRYPTAIITAAVTMLSTALYVAPSVGIAIPDSAQKIITLVLMAAGGLGIHSLVTPVAAPNLPAKK